MQGQVSKTSIFSENAWIFDALPKNHALKFIMAMLDFSFIKSITKNSYHDRMGRPSVDPEIFFRMTLIGYLYGIKSDRRLCEEIQCNLLYRWFCFIPFKSKVPHYSSLSRIRLRLGVVVFQEIFDAIVNKCIELGIVKGDKIMTDSSLIRANASLNSLLPKNKDCLDTIKNNKKKKYPMKPILVKPTPMPLLREKEVRPEH